MFSAEIIIIVILSKGMLFLFRLETFGFNAQKPFKPFMYEKNMGKNAIRQCDLVIWNDLLFVDIMQSLWGVKQESDCIPGNFEFIISVLLTFEWCILTAYFTNEKF